jgi:hypothetical protein
MDQSQSTHSIKALPRGLSAAAQQRRLRFLTDYKQSLHDVVQSVALAVLVWGPALDIDTPVAKKRWEIRAKLEENGHFSMFSEELDDGNDPLDQLLAEGQGLLLKALLQAKHADFLILLLDNRASGVISELSICERRDIAAKVFVLVPEIFRNTFVHRGAIATIEGGNGAVDWYTEDEVTSCNVLTKAVLRVEQRRLLCAYERAMVER